MMMKDSDLPAKMAEVKFDYQELDDPQSYSFNMRILTGFCGMAVDQDGFIRPQIGWSIHCFDEKFKPINIYKQSRNYSRKDPIEYPDLSKEIEGLLSKDAANILRLQQ